MVRAWEFDRRQNNALQSGEKPLVVNEVLAVNQLAYVYSPSKGVSLRETEHPDYCQRFLKRNTMLTILLFYIFFSYVVMTGILLDHPNFNPLLHGIYWALSPITIIAELLMA